MIAWNRKTLNNKTSKEESTSDMADTISLPSVLPSDNKKISRNRRRSIEDYHRIIIERIKGHFDKRRKQWDLDLKRKSECLSRTSSLNYIPDNISPSDKCSKISEGCQKGKTGSDLNDAFNQKGGKACSRNASVKVMSTSLVTDEAEVFDRLKLELDISEYLPNGEVRFTSTKEGILVCAKYVQEGEGSFEKVKVIPVDGLIENERLRFRPSSKGSMVLEVCVKKREK